MAANSSSMNSDDDVWIYHEKQEALLCGQHALNNLTQSPVFNVGQLSHIAHELDERERGVMEPSAASTPSANVDEAGNFSIQVLEQALSESYGVSLPHVSVALRESKRDITEFQGFVVHRSDHWFAIRSIGGRFWNLNSTLERPEPISHFQLATEMEQWQMEGYTVFAISSGLPVLSGEKIEGLGEGTWHKMSDLLRGKSTSADPWAGITGRGMRLDSGSVRGSSSDNNGTTGMSQEEEELQRALAMSLQENETKRQNEQLSNVDVPQEPPVGTPGAVRLQLRLPDGRRLVRRFNESDSVRVVYAVVRQKQQEGDAASQMKRIELRCGFPPKDMVDLQELTIGQAKLAGESIQGRYV